MINVADVMTTNEATPKVTMKKVTSRYEAIRRLDMVCEMMENLERSVNNANIGMGDDWREAYDNLYNALHICKEAEKELI